MKIDTLPNEDLQKIASKVDDGDKDLNKEEFNVFLEAASKALSKNEISLEKFNQIWGLNIVASAKTEVQQNPKFKDISNSELHQKIIENNELIAQYKENIDSSDVNYGFYSKMINTRASKLASGGTVIGGCLMGMSGGISGLFDKANISIIKKGAWGIGLLGTAMMLCGIGAMGVQWYRSNKAEKSEEQRTAIFDFYKQQLEKLQNENKEYEKELACRVNGTLA